MYEKCLKSAKSSSIILERQHCLKADWLKMKVLSQRPIRKHTEIIIKGEQQIFSKWQIIRLLKLEIRKHLKSLFNQVDCYSNILVDIVWNPNIRKFGFIVRKKQHFRLWTKPMRPESWEFRKIRLSSPIWDRRHIFWLEPSSPLTKKRKKLLIATTS